jgi:exosortase/archaeosortase family protein
MLWGALALASGLCAWTGSRALPTAAVLAATFVVVVAANILRASLLFFKEAHVVNLPEWTHPAIGCACFALAVIAIFRLPGLFDRARAV